MTETPKELAREAQRGASSRTPWLALSGVTIALSVFVGVVVAVALVLYYVV